MQTRHDDVVKFSACGVETLSAILSQQYEDEWKTQRLLKQLVHLQFPETGTFQDAEIIERKNEGFKGWCADAPRSGLRKVSFRG